MKIEKIKNVFYVLATALAAIVVGMILFRFLAPVMLPFLISYSIACLTTKPAIFLEKKLGKPRRIIRLLISLLSLVFLSVALFFIGKYAALTLWKLATDILEGDSVNILINKILAPIEATLGDMMPDELQSQITDGFLQLLSSLLSSLGGILSSLASFLPKVFLFLVITLISLIYFALDLEPINEKIQSLLPEKVGKYIVDIRERFLSIGVKYVYSYLIIMGITFSIVVVGFLILGVRHAALLAMIIAFFDIFPVIGVGTVLIPWAVIELIIGNTGRGVGLIVLFVVNEIIRQFAEPKIVGKNLNLHPVITLILIYASISIFGVSGILLIPVFTVIINVLQGD